MLPCAIFTLSVDASALTSKLLRPTRVAAGIQLINNSLGTQPYGACLSTFMETRMHSIKNVQANKPSSNNLLSFKLKSFVKRFINDEENKSNPLDEQVMVILAFAVLAYFVGDWLFSYIDQNFLSVACKAKYFVSP